MTGYSLHIGLNRVDPKQYNGWDGRLQSAETDARDMEAIASAQGFHTQSLIGPQATARNVLARIREVAAIAKSGDTFLVTNAGHGSQLPNLNGDDEPTGKDSTLVHYDRMLVDDELYAAWNEFDEGVQIYAVFDQCHAGTATRFMPASLVEGIALKARGFPDAEQTIVLARCMPTDAWETYFAAPATKNLYMRIKKDVAVTRGAREASVVLLAACQDDQLAGDLPTNGLFTDTLKKVWNGGRFAGSYLELLDRVKAGMPKTQEPNFFPFGPHADEMAKQRAFQLRNREPRQHQENDSMNGYPTKVTEKTREVLDAGNGAFGRGEEPFGLRCILDFDKYFDEGISDRDGLGEFVATQVAPVVVEALLQAAGVRQKIQANVTRGRGMQIMGRGCEVHAGVDHEGHAHAEVVCKF